MLATIYRLRNLPKYLPKCGGHFKSVSGSKLTRIGMLWICVSPHASTIVFQFYPQGTFQMSLMCLTALELPGIMNRYVFGAAAVSKMESSMCCLVNCSLALSHQTDECRSCLWVERSDHFNFRTWEVWQEFILMEHTSISNKEVLREEQNERLRLLSVS